MKSGTFLKQLREASGISKEDIAKRIGSRVHLVNMVEMNNSEYSWEQVRIICNRMGLSANLMLIAISEEPKELDNDDLEKFLSIQTNVRKLLLIEVKSPNNVQ